MSARDSRQLVKALRRLGWRLEQRTQGVMVYSPDGRRLLLHETPSGPRWLRNKRAALRRLGADI